MASGIPTTAFMLLKVRGIGSYRIHKDGWVWERRGLPVDRVSKMRNDVQMS